jgi:hypothetical protein
MTRNALATCHGKLRWDCEAQALRIIDQAKDARKRGHEARQERRAYFCERCRGWHVTSR